MFSFVLTIHIVSSWPNHYSLWASFIASEFPITLCREANMSDPTCVVSSGYC